MPTYELAADFNKTRLQEWLAWKIGARVPLRFVTEARARRAGLLRAGGSPFTTATLS